MSEKLPYPSPVEDADNCEYLQGWRRGALRLPHCLDCDRSFHYPRPVCPHCWSERLEWRDASGRGQIVAFSLVYRPNHESFNEEAPIVLAEIALPEGPSLIARVLGCDPAAVRSGQAVSLTGDASRHPLPTFAVDL